MGADDEVLVHGAKGSAFVFRASCRSREHPSTEGVAASVAACCSVSCSVLQCASSREHASKGDVLRRVLQRVTVSVAVCARSETSLHHTAKNCNTLHHAATHCNAMQRTATPCNMPQHTATHCNTLLRTVTRCNTQHTVTHSDKM